MDVKEFFGHEGEDQRLIYASYEDRYQFINIHLVPGGPELRLGASREPMPPPRATSGPSFSFEALKLPGHRSRRYSPRPVSEDSAALATPVDSPPRPSLPPSRCLSFQLPPVQVQNVRWMLLPGSPELCRVPLNNTTDPASATAGSCSNSDRGLAAPQSRSRRTLQPYSPQPCAVSAAQ